MKNLLVLPFLALMLFGCGPTLYIPNSLNTPLLGEKGDFQVRGGMNLTSPSPNLNLQGAYAVNDKLAVMTNLAHMNFIESADLKNGNKHSLVEVGLGRYWAFSPNKCKVNVGRFEVFGGSGLGWATDNDFYNNTKHYYQGSYNRWFLQPAVGYKGKVFEASFATRLAYTNFMNYLHEANGQDITDNEQFSFATIEPVVNLALGYKRGKAFWQFGFVEPLNGEGSDYYAVSTDVITNLHFNIGFTFNPWKEDCPLNPAVVLSEPKRKEEVPEPAHENQPSAEVIEVEATSPATIIPLSQPNATICVRDGGSPDGDVVSISFNGSFLAQDLELAKRKECFDIFAQKDEENLLQIHAISDGKFLPNTVQITVKEGRSERTFYIRTEKGRTEEIRFSF